MPDTTAPAAHIAPADPITHAETPMQAEQANLDAARARIRMVAQSTFQNARIQNGKEGVVLDGEQFDAPDEAYAREAIRTRLAVLVDPDRLGPSPELQAPVAHGGVSIANVSRPGPVLPDTAISPRGKGKAGATLAALAILVLFGLARPAHAQNALNGVFPVVLTTTPVQVLPIAPNRSFQRIINVDTSGTAWCRRMNPADVTIQTPTTPSVILANPPAPNVAGSFPLGFTGNTANLPTSEEFNVPGFIPKLQLWCRAASNTVQLTAEAY